MTDMPFIVAAYLVVALSLGAYTWGLRARHRAAASLTAELDRVEAGRAPTESSHDVPTDGTRIDVHGEPGRGRAPVGERA